MIGARLGPYRIDRELGSGGMGKVYAAVVVDRVPGLAEGQVVALKVVHPHLLETPGFFHRFLREAEIGRSVVHENVVRTFDCDQLLVDGSRLSFLTMEYVEGQTLRDLLRELERVPEELCRHIGREVAKGLAAIHAAGVVHRDVKPENVLITKEHVVKVMDLGVARLNDEALRLSQTGAFVGSLHYAAPECLKDGGRDVDGRADLHALGLVLYELSCGVNPYYAEDLPQVLSRVLHEAPRRLGDVNPQLSPFFEETVHCLLEKRPGNRFGSASELLAALEAGEGSAWWRSRAKALRAVTDRPLRRVRVPRETAVYGRESELSKLRAAYERAKRGEGQVVLVEGEAGIGKTRLVDELIGRLQRDGEDLNFLFGSYPPNGAATASGAFSSAYREQFGEEGCASHLPQSPILVPAFDALLRGESVPTGVEPLTKDSLQTCFVQATRALAAERTTVVLIDDLHFAPEEGRALFTALAMAVPGHRILLLGTVRPGAGEGWQAGLERFGHTSRLTPQRLAAKDLVQLLEDAFRSKVLAETLGLQIVVKSDGNPFFAFEIIRGLREGQFVTQRADGTWVTTGVIDEIRIPSSVLDLVNARVSALTQAERDLLDIASCWGFEFDPGLISEVLGVARIPLLKQLAQIERSNRLVRASGRSFSFDHHQVQEALYASLPEMLREEYHAALAATLESRAKATGKAPSALDGALCVDLVEHFLKGNRGAQALPYLAAAQAHLERGYLNDAAVRIAERALGSPGLLAGVERARVLLTLCGPNGPLDRLGRRSRQEAAAREAARLAADAGDEAMHALADSALGTVLSRTARHAEAEEAFRRVLNVAKSSGDRPGEAGAQVNLGNVFLAQGRLPEAREHFELGRTISTEIGHRTFTSNVTGSLGLVLFSQGHLAEAEALHGRHLALCRELRDRMGEARATGNLGILYKAQGRLVEARVHHQRHLALSRDLGYRQGEALATGNLGMVYSALGRLAEGRAQTERQLALMGELGSHWGEAVARHNLATVFLEEGDTASAEGHLRTCLASCEELGFREIAAATHLELGALRASTGDPEAARASLAAARDLAGKIGVAGIDTLARCHLACLPGGEAGDASAAFVANEGRLKAEERREALLLLWKSTGDRSHLAEAKRLVEEALSKVPEEDRAAMRDHVRVHREIMQAARAEGL